MISIRLVKRLQTAVVEEPLLLDRIERDPAERPGWRPVSDRTFASDFREVLDRLIEQPFLLAWLEAEELVNPSVDTNPRAARSSESLPLSGFSIASTAVMKKVAGTW